jgi:hypothetical protein
MWMTILRFLTGGFLDTLAKAYTAKLAADTDRFKSGVAVDHDVALKQIDAEIEARKLAAAARAADRGSLWTAWMLPSAFGLCLVHFGAVILDSVPLLGHEIGSWRIPELPGQYAGMEQSIILSIAGVVGVTKVARLFSAK